jgi:hypothetical protein
MNTQKEMVNIIELYELPTSIPDLSTFDGRYYSGKGGEGCGTLAVETNIIENFGFHLAIKVDKNSNKSKLLNAVQGDILIHHPLYPFDIQNIDFKNTTFISDYSLTTFKKNGWFFLNAFVLSKGSKYFMVRNSEAFQDFAKQFPERNGYRIDINKLQNAHANVGLEFYLFFDPGKYKNLIHSVRTQYEIKYGMPISIIDKIIKIVD